jgi:GNAT superfamily N-acetyltransferase
MHLVRIDTTNPLYEKAVALRDAVLRAPLGMVFTAEELALDAGREHLVAVEGDAVVGSVSFYLEAIGRLRVKQMAVDPAYQGRGIGAQLMRAAEARGRELGAQEVLLHARCTALNFYDRQGYAAQGAAFEELGISHRIMVKRMVKPLA